MGTATGAFCAPGLVRVLPYHLLPRSGCERVFFRHGEAMRSTESSKSRRLGFVTLLGLLALSSVSGCKESGSRGTSVVIPPVSVTALQVVPDPDNTHIQYSLVSPNSHPMSVVVEVSEDLGQTFQVATVSHSMSNQEADPNGVNYSVSWVPSADLSSLDQGDLILRLVPTDEVTGLVWAKRTNPSLCLGHQHRASDRLTANADDVARRGSPPQLRTR